MRITGIYFEDPFIAAYQKQTNSAKELFLLRKSNFNFD